jgi:hypothetical protein
MPRSVAMLVSVTGAVAVCLYLEHSISSNESQCDAEVFSKVFQSLRLCSVKAETS